MREIAIAKNKKMPEILIQEKSLTVRSRDREDARLLAKWLSNPQVLAHYEGRDNPHDLTKVQEKFYTEGRITRCIFTWDDFAIDPETWNVRAIRVISESRIKKIKLLPQYELHEGKWCDSWLMEFCND